MSDYIPFVNSISDKSTTLSVYEDASFYRLALQSPDKTASDFPSNAKLWVDAGIDALHNWPADNNPNYRAYLSGFPRCSDIAAASFQARPDKKVVAEFVSAALDSLLSRISNPEWISVPQLPYLDGVERNKINRALAEGAQAWKAKGNHRAKFILPIILTNQRQINKKTERNRKVLAGVSCMEASGSVGVWTVEVAAFPGP